MNAYADTSFLVPLLTRESTSDRAIKEANRLTEPLPLVFLNSVEFINALNTRVFRNEITVRVRNAALAKFEEYLGQGAFIREILEPEELRSRAEHLSHQYSPKHGVRSLDLFHITAAQMLGCRRFLTFDDRQALVARKEKLNVAPK